MNALSSLISSLPSPVRDSLDSLFSSVRFTESQKLEIVKEEADLVQWKEKSFVLGTDISSFEKNDGRAGERYIAAMRLHMAALRSAETDYSTFFPQWKKRPMVRSVEDTRPLVLSRCPCPVDGEKTRCCKLRTLDAVTQCAFGCAYCSIQAFYNENEIRVVPDLAEKLEGLETGDDVWHIGTGQASDSLLFGDDHGTLSALASFALSHPETVIELKSKSGRDVFSRRWPENMVFTWSLNASVIIEKEEHFTASLEERLENARRARDGGNLVGFHIHPMFLFKGWEDGYREVVEKIVSTFSPDEVLMIGIGTLTFTKAVLRRLRETGAESRVLEMELVKEAGKFSYPLEKKRKMFSTLHSFFPKEWKRNVFFFLCMEDPSLWMPCLGREYPSDRAFEEDMRRRYLEKIRALRRKHGATL